MGIQTVQKVFQLTVQSNNMDDLYLDVCFPHKRAHNYGVFASESVRPTQSGFKWSNCNKMCVCESYLHIRVVNCLNGVEVCV